MIKMYLKDNDLDTNTYLKLRKSVNWKPLTEKQAEKAIENSILKIGRAHV